MKLNDGETTSLAFGILYLSHLCVWKAAGTFVVGSPFYLSVHIAIEKSRQRKKSKWEKKKKRQEKHLRGPFLPQTKRREITLLQHTSAHTSMEMEGPLKASVWHPQLQAAGQPQRAEQNACPDVAVHSENPTEVPCGTPTTADAVMLTVLGNSISQWA